MKTVSIALFALGYLGIFAFALKLLLARSYFPYHRQVTGKTWEELDDGVRVVIGGFMRLFGGALLAAAATGAWMIWLYATGGGIPSLLVALPGVVIGAMTLSVTSMLIAHGGTDAPRIQVAVLTLIAIGGAVTGMIAG